MNREVLQANLKFDEYRDFKAYVINLDREPLRYARTRQNLISAGFTNILRLPAVDYTYTDVFAEVDRLGFRYSERFNNTKEAARLLSHFRAMHIFLASNDEYCFVFEDDIKFTASFSESSTFDDIAYADIDVLSFGTVFSGENFYSDKLIDTSPLDRARKEGRSYVEGFRFKQAHAYLISRRAAYKLTQNYAEWANLKEYKCPSIASYLSDNNFIRAKLLANRPDPNLINHDNSKKYTGSLSGLVFQEKFAQPCATQVANKNLTVIISGSYIKFHPSITYIKEVIESLDFAGIPYNTPILLSHDRIKPDRLNEIAEKNYAAYFRNLEDYIATSKYVNITILKASQWGHLTRTLKQAVAQVDTKYMLLLQHDIHFKRDVPVLKIIDLMEKYPHMKHVRFNTRKNLPTFIGWDGWYRGRHCVFSEEEYDGLKFCVTPAWSDQNHLTTKEYYETRIFPDCVNVDGELMYDFMENRINTLCLHDPAKYGTYIYGEYKAARTSRNADGQKSSPERDED